MRIFSTLLIVAFVALSCATPAILVPPNGPGTDWACRPTEHDCGNDHCCLDGYDCGGGAFNGCPPDSCCAGASDGVMARRSMPQTAKRQISK